MLIAIGLLIVIFSLNVLTARDNTIVNMLGEEQKSKKKDRGSNVSRD